VIRAAVARALERGALRSRPTVAAARLWEARAVVARPVALPSRARVIGVGGATLGGSHKTPLTLALALRLSHLGASVSVVAHGYGARIRGARVVDPADAARDVGDDAAWLARELSGGGVPVTVGERGAALAISARAASVVLVDGLLQAQPRPLDLSLLALDAASPWGADACPPAGDRRASRAALLGATDAVVAVHDGPLRDDALADVARVVPVFGVRAELAVASADGRPLALSELRGARVGVVLAVARPDRVLCTLAAHGIHPVATRLFADHAFPLPRAGRDDVDIWLTTPKCATKLDSTYDGVPVAVLRRTLALPDALLARCVEAIGRHGG
jgi:tetraacyldisaccharide 4'-kinase